MATIVNTPASDSSGNGIGMILGALLILLVAFLFFVYGLPMMRGGSSSAPAPQPNNTEINMPQPESNNGGTQVPQINIPDQIDVNVNNPGNSQAPQGGTQPAQ